MISRAATTKLLSPLTPWCCCQRIPLLLLLFNITLPSASIPTGKYNPNSCRHSWNDCRADEEFVRLQLSKTTSWVRYLITSAQFVVRPLRSTLQLLWLAEFLQLWSYKFLCIPRYDFIFSFQKYIWKTEILKSHIASFPQSFEICFVKVVYLHFIQLSLHT